ncbi:MFS transporter [Enterovirga sp.]|uniref:MFS transporter n=1 Tax=Enterovirga sp. TaxID=2026350 RepID=UPI002605C499|nr:MFS transporter [Enterovirga sp.]MDB5591670.1 transporter [Enterovirga sp.]
MSLPAAPPSESANIRRTILILSVCGFASALSTRFADPMIGVIARDLAVDPLRVALLSTAYALPYAFIQPILGPFGDAVGKERVVKVLLVCLAVSLLAASFATDLTALFVLRVLSGAAAGGIIPIALATIGDRVEMGERQVAIGRFLTATISGQLLGGVGSGALATVVSWRGVFMIAAASAAAAAVAVMIGFRSSGGPRGVFSLRVAGQRYRRILSIPRALALIFFVFVEGLFVFGVQPYVAPLLEREGLGGPTEAGLIIGGFAIGGIIYTLIVRWLLSTLGLPRMLRTAGFLGLGSFVLLAPGLPWGVQALAMVGMGMGFYMLHNSFQTQITEVVPEARASAVALHAFCFFIGQALGPVLFGLLLGTVDRTGAMLACGMGVLSLGLVAAVVLRDAYPRPR